MKPKHTPGLHPLFEEILAKQCPDLAEERFKAWSEKHAERLHASWLEHIDYLQDSSEHKAYLRRSDRCFEEYCRAEFERTKAGEP